jgi:hypothetical protein
MDSTLDALKARFPGMEWEWEPDVGGWVGGCGSVAVHVEVETDGSAWAHGWIGNDTSIGTTGADPVAAVEKLAIHKGFADALRSTPPKAEYIPPTPEQLATAQTPQDTPFPAMMARLLPGCLGALAWVVAETVWLWRWHLLLFGMALGCGAGGMWWLTGGGQ